MKLPFRFDPAQLAEDVAAAAAIAGWEAHFNSDDHDGAWSGIALRGNSSSALLTLYIDPSRMHAFEETEALAHCPYVRELLKSFDCPLLSVRFLKLAPAASIHEHRDVDVCLERGEMRMHVPVTTNRSVDFFVGGERLELQPGDCWYLDLDLPHRVANRGTTDRIHLVIDAVANDWARELVREAASHGS